MWHNVWLFFLCSRRTGYIKALNQNTNALPNASSESEKKFESAESHEKKTFHLSSTCAPDSKAFEGTPLVKGLEQCGDVKLHRQLQKHGAEREMGETDKEAEALQRLRIRPTEDPWRVHRVDLDDSDEDLAASSDGVVRCCKASTPTQTKSAPSIQAWEHTMEPGLSARHSELDLHTRCSSPPPRRALGPRDLRGLGENTGELIRTSGRNHREPIELADDHYTGLHGQWKTPDATKNPVDLSSIMADTVSDSTIADSVSLSEFMTVSTSSGSSASRTDALHANRISAPSDSDLTDGASAFGGLEAKDSLTLYPKPKHARASPAQLSTDEHAEGLEKPPIFVGARDSLTLYPKKLLASRIRVSSGVTFAAEACSSENDCISAAAHASSIGSPSDTHHLVSSTCTASSTDFSRDLHQTLEMPHSRSVPSIVCRHEMFLNRNNNNQNAVNSEVQEQRDDANKNNSSQRVTEPLGGITARDRGGMEFESDLDDYMPVDESRVLRRSFTGLSPQSRDAIDKYLGETLQSEASSAASEDFSLPRAHDVQPEAFPSEVGDVVVKSGSPENMDSDLSDRSSPEPRENACAPEAVIERDTSQFYFLCNISTSDDNSEEQEDEDITHVGLQDVQITAPAEDARSQCDGLGLAAVSLLADLSEGPDKTGDQKCGVQHGNRETESDSTNNEGSSVDATNFDTLSLTFETEIGGERKPCFLEELTDENKGSEMTPQHYSAGKTGVTSSKKASEEGSGTSTSDDEDLQHDIGSGRGDTGESVLTTEDEQGDWSCTDLDQELSNDLEMAAARASDRLLDETTCSMAELAELGSSESDVDPQLDLDLDEYDSCCSSSSSSGDDDADDAQSGEEADSTPRRCDPREEPQFLTDHDEKCGYAEEKTTQIDEVMTRDDIETPFDESRDQVNEMLFCGEEIPKEVFVVDDTDGSDDEEVTTAAKVDVISDVWDETGEQAKSGREVEEELHRTENDVEMKNASDEEMQKVNASDGVVREAEVKSSCQDERRPHDMGSTSTADTCGYQCFEESVAETPSSENIENAEDILEVRSDQDSGDETREYLGYSHTDNPIVLLKRRTRILTGERADGNGAVERDGDTAEWRSEGGQGEAESSAGVRWGLHSVFTGVNRPRVGQEIAAVTRDPGASGDESSVDEEQPRAVSCADPGSRTAVLMFQLLVTVLFSAGTFCLVYVCVQGREYTCKANVSRDNCPILLMCNEV